ncbi:MAG: N-acetylneuraminate synthase family protein [Alteromonadaceae bacterium]|nr:N-acetylneuraminate synthase family protein [Alteromonadaceae bacterium]
MKIISEAAMNHFGSVPLLWNCAETSIRAGADYVKFQLIRDEELYAGGQYEYGTYNIDDVRWLRHHSRIPHQEYRAVADRAADLAGYRCVSSTPFDLHSLDELLETDPPFIKIASGDNNYMELIDAAGKSGRPVIVSTGMSTTRQIDTAVDRLMRHTSNIVVMHCVAAYPHECDEALLGTIPWLQQRYGVPIGYSDHSLGYGAAMLAASLGVEWFEKHFTLSPANGGLDVKHSVTPEELAMYCRMVRSVKPALEGARKEPTDAERYTAQRARRGLYFRDDLPAGHVVQREDIAYLRPERDFALEDVETVIGRKLVSPGEKGAPIMKEDLT